MADTNRSTSLKSKIMVSTVIPVALSFLVIISLIFAALFHSLREAAKAEFSLKGHEYAHLFKYKIDNAMNYLTIMASLLETRAGTAEADRVELQRTALTIFEHYKLIDGSSIYFEPDRYDGKDAEYTGSEYGTATSGRICYYFYIDEGETAYLPEGLEDDVEFELPHYTEAKEANVPVYTKPTVHEVDGKKLAMFTITYPIRDEAGAFIGAVTVDLFLEDIYAQLQSEEIYETGYIVITSDRDQVIYSPRYEDVGKSRGEAGADYAMPSGEGTVAYANAPSLVNGKTCLITTVPVYIPQLDRFFYISVAAPISEIYAGGVRLVLILLVFSAMLIIMIGSIVYYLVGKITDPIKRITESANGIAAGNIGTAMELDGLYEKDEPMDEVHTLFLALKKMLSQITEVQNLKLEALELTHQKEKAEAEARAKSDFLAKMSHEIRTPMNAIMGMSELILRRDLDQDLYENALGIKSASSNLLSIINDILDFSKIESGMTEIIETPYRLSSLINDVVSIIRMRLLEKPVLFSVYVDCNLPATLTGDEIRIRQILLNLLGNAVKYTAEGFISLAVSGSVREGAVTLEIDISDSGVGIREEDIASLFGDFVQVDLAKNKGVEGTGLGLAIARGLCRAMGGDVTVKSRYGEGSTFTVTLPQGFDSPEPFAAVRDPGGKSVLLYETRAVYESSMLKTLENLGVPCKKAPNIASLFEELDQFPYLFISSFCYDSMKPVLNRPGKAPLMVLLADASESIAPKDARVLTMPANALSVANVLNDVHEDFAKPFEVGVSFTAPTARVLLVDDISANLKVAEGLMAPYEMRIDTCKSGLEAVRMVADNAYDLVFMDHMMPEMDGIEATAHIRAMEGEYYQNLPIVALTANAVSGVREMFIQNGMNDFLAKPIEMRKLDAILEKWIPREKRERPAEEEAPVGDSLGFVSRLKWVPGLSVDRALSMAGGSAAAYERVVKLTARLLPENIRKLDDLIGTDLSLYAIEVHGVKGVLNNIGAYALGDVALRLETLSGQGDADACRALHPGFAEGLMKFWGTLMPLVDEADADHKPEGDAAAVLEALPRIMEAADLFDSALALEILLPICGYTYGDEADEILGCMARAFERFDFDEVARLSEELKGAVCANG